MKEQIHSTSAEETAARFTIPQRLLPLSYPAMDVPGHKPGTISAMVSAKGLPHLAIINPTFDNDLRARFGNLFAAAPELLEACKEASKLLCHIGVTGDPVLFRIQDAIAKAEGRVQ